ncbi:MAG: hypothetical protein GY915_02055 [bacterium]|nr:hypothetical protein [bacterium]
MSQQETQKETMTMDSGLQYQELEVGKGDSPEKGSTVVVHYTGWLGLSDSLCK